MNLQAEQVSTQILVFFGGNVKPVTLPETISGVVKKLRVRHGLTLLRSLLIVLGAERYENSHSLALAEWGQHWVPERLIKRRHRESEVGEVVADLVERVINEVVAALYDLAVNDLAGLHKPLAAHPSSVTPLVL
jgi:hypothetical protein